MKHPYSKLLLSLPLSVAPLLLVMACDTGSSGDGVSASQGALELGDTDGDGVLSAPERDVLSSKCHARGEPSHEADDSDADGDHDAAGGHEADTDQEADTDDEAEANDDGDAADDEADEADEADDTMMEANGADGDVDADEAMVGEAHTGADKDDESGEADADEQEVSEHQTFHAVCVELFDHED